MATTTTMWRARTATAADLPALCATFAAAFLDDPVFRWGIQDDDRRRDILPRFFGIVTRANLPHGATYTTDDLVSGAVWVPAGSDGDDEALVGALAEACAEYADSCFEAFGLMAQEHPRDPHHYLFFLGTRPEWQSRGIGSALMKPVLERCDATGMPAYLEASSERNKALYRRHGFEVVDTINLPGGPTMWCMWRTPVSRAGLGTRDGHA
jgi:GNAT superfamily N-acetyltransferase